MDRRAKKIEKKRKDRERAKQKASALAARKPSSLELLQRSAARGAFGPCFISAGWEDTTKPKLVAVLVTRKLPSGELLPGTALVDRTCLGVKNAYMREPMLARDLSDFVDRLGASNDGMLACEPIVAQSVVFHAIDYARTLGFEPHPDFPEALFGPRPETLLETAWCAPDKPFYISGPNDDVAAIMSRLDQAVGADGFKSFRPMALADELEDPDDEVEFVDDEDVELVHSPLERSISRDGVELQICIYREAQTGWFLEIEDHLGGSTVWDEPFPTDQAAYDAAMQAIEEDGASSFIASP